MLHVTFTIGFTNVTLTMREARELVGYMAHAAHEMKFNPLDRFDRKASYERVRYTHIAHTDRYAFFVDDVCVLDTANREQLLDEVERINHELDAFEIKHSFTKEIGALDLGDAEPENELRVIATKLGRRLSVRLKTTTEMDDILEDPDRADETVLDLHLSTIEAKQLMHCLKQAIELLEENR